jgi:threonine synthase
VFVNAPLKLSLGEQIVVGVAKKLIASGKIPRNDSVVLCVTGNGLKTLDAVAGHRGQAARNQAQPARVRSPAGA